MLFTDPTFLFFWLPVLLASYFVAVGLTPSDSRTGGRNAARSNWIILLASLAVCAAATGSFTWLLVATVVLSDLGARGIRRAQEAQAGTVPEALLTLVLSGNILLFVACKYAYPGVWTPTSAMVHPFAVPQLLVPFALAIVVCHAIGYQLDVYQGRTDPYPSPIDGALSMLFLPVLVSGPILRHRDTRDQFVTRQVGMAAFSYGVRRFAVGLGKVFLIAHTLSAPADHIFGQSPAGLSLAEAWLGAVCFSLQIYFDLSGYADMAVGLGRMLGFRMPENFRWPYAADSLHEFWRRWQLSLVGWARVYCALPLETGSARSWRSDRDLLLLFLFVGLWHGPGWNVVWWGVFHGGVVALERRGLGTRIKRLPAGARHAYTLLVAMLGWVIFRTDTLGDAMRYSEALLGLTGLTPTSLSLPVTAPVVTALVAGTVGAVPLVSWLSRWVVTVDSMATSLLMLVSTAVVFVWRTGARTVDAVFALWRR